MLQPARRIRKRMGIYTDMTTRIENQPVAPPLYIDSTNQRVGVNVANPTQILDVGGSTASFQISNPANLRITLNATKFLYINVGAAGSHTWLCNSTGIANLNATGDFVCGSASNAASAQLQADSTTKGFLPPRMTTAQKGAISSPATGLVVYDTDLDKLCVYTGAAWETITSA